MFNCHDRHGLLDEDAVAAVFWQSHQTEETRVVCSVRISMRSPVNPSGG